MLDYRQGDVGLVRCTIPKEAKRIPLRPLALGKITGHSHRVAVNDAQGVEMYELGGQTFLRVTADGAISLVHEEHDPTGTKSFIPEGWEGEVVIAREYDEEEDFRRVLD